VALEHRRSQDFCCLIHSILASDFDLFSRQWIHYTKTTKYPMQLLNYTKMLVLRGALLFLGGGGTSNLPRKLSPKIISRLLHPLATFIALKFFLISTIKQPNKFLLTSSRESRFRVQAWLLFCLEDYQVFRSDVGLPFRRRTFGPDHQRWMSSRTSFFQRIHHTSTDPARAYPCRTWLAERE